MRPVFGSNRFDFARAAACRLNFTLCEAARLQILKFAALALAALIAFYKSKFQIDLRLSFCGDGGFARSNFKIATLKYVSFRPLICCVVSTSPRRGGRRAESLRGRLLRRRFILHAPSKFNRRICALTLRLPAHFADPHRIIRGFAIVF